MKNIRHFGVEDIPQVVALSERVFGASNQTSRAALAAYFEEVFFRNPWSDPAFPSLVYEESSGRISGFIGVMPRRLLFCGQPVQLAVGNYFMVEPDRRFTLAGVELAKAFLAGPQDLSLAEGNDFSRRVWEGLGGATEALYSLYWLRPLRPGRYLVSLLSRHGLWTPLALASKPLGWLLDAVGPRLSANLFRQDVPTGSREELNEVAFLECLANFSSHWRLRPHYDSRALQWLLALLAQKRRYGTLRKVLVRSADQQILGWYLYYVNPGGVGEVLQVGAKKNSVLQVLDHLFYEAERQGVVALSGRVDPLFMPEFCVKQCVLRCGPPWMLLHSRRPEILDVIHRGSAFLTRLEGEWWIGF